MNGQENFLGATICRLQSYKYTLGILGAEVYKYTHAFLGRVVRGWVHMGVAAETQSMYPPPLDLTKRLAN